MSEHTAPNNTSICLALDIQTAQIHANMEMATLDTMEQAEQIGPEFARVFKMGFEAGMAISQHAQCQYSQWVYDNLYKPFNNKANLCVLVGISLLFIGR